MISTNTNPLKHLKNKKSACGLFLCMPSSSMHAKLCFYGPDEYLWKKFRDYLSASILNSFYCVLTFHF
jgi:hypothetical protein